MTYSIIGSGNVGTALARHFSRSGISVGIANTRGPDSIAALAKELGDSVIPLTMDDALKADVIILAVPFRAHADIARLLPTWAGKLIVDTMNSYGVTSEELRGRPSSEVVAQAFNGSILVKTLNQLPAKLLAQDPAVNGGRRVMFVSSDDHVAETQTAKLVAQLGFAPIQLGKIASGGLLIGMGGALILQNLVKQA